MREREARQKNSTQIYVQEEENRDTDKRREKNREKG